MGGGVAWGGGEADSPAAAGYNLSTGGSLALHEFDGITSLNNIWIGR